MILKQGWLKFWRWAVVGFAGLLVLTLLTIPVRLAIAMRQSPRPEAILVLGGDARREEAAAQLGRHYSALDIWVSTGELRPRSEAIFYRAGIPDDRVYLDYRAVDTVTNFTTLVADLRQRGIHHVFVVTSDFHMPRAKAIATIVLGSQGIAFTPVVVPSDRADESSIRIARDVGRSILWLFTGRTGASLEERLPDRKFHP